MLQRFGLSDSFVRIPRDFLKKLIYLFENSFIGLLPVNVILPRPGGEKKAHASVKSLSFFLIPFPFLRSPQRFGQASGIGRGAKEVGSFLERLIIFQ